MFVGQTHVSTVQGSIWDINNFLWLQKLKRSFNRKILYATFTDSCWCALCIFNNLWLRMGWFSLRRLFVSLSRIFPSEEKGMYPPYGAGPVCRRKNYLLFIFQEHKNVRESSECSHNSLENSIFWNKTYLHYFVHSLHTFFPLPPWFSRMFS